MSEREEQVRKAKEKSIETFTGVMGSMINSLQIESLVDILMDVIDHFNSVAEKDRVDHGSTCLFFAYQPDGLTIHIRYDKSYTVLKKGEEYKIGYGHNVQPVDMIPLGEAGIGDFRYVLKVLTKQMLDNCNMMSSLLTYTIEHKQ